MEVQRGRVKVPGREDGGAGREGGWAGWEGERTGAIQFHNALPNWLNF